MNKSDGVRLNKYIAQAGLASRRRADQLIAYGKVRVNGRVCRELGTIVAPGDTVDVSGTPIAPRAVDATYLVMHKPAGVMTTMRDPQGRRTIVELIPKKLPRIVPVGRLDYDTAGVLLLTNDGELANRIATQPVMKQVRHGDEAVGRRKQARAPQLRCIELVERIDRHKLYAGLRIDFFARHNPKHRFHDSARSVVTIMMRIFEKLALFT